MLSLNRPELCQGLECLVGYEAPEARAEQRNRRLIGVVAILVLGNDVTERVVRQAKKKGLLESQKLASILDLKIKNTAHLTGDRHQRDLIVERDPVHFRIVLRGKGDSRRKTWGRLRLD